MRTDICIVDELTKTVTSIDAKYYQATTPENASGWRYLVKQFFYEKALGTLPKYSTYNIKNLLIFPGENSILHQIRMGNSVQLYRLTFC